MLLKRTISAFVMLPLPLLAVYFGSPWLELILLLLAASMAWEWDTMFNRKSTVYAPIAATIATASVLLWQSHFWVVLSLAPLAAIVSFFVLRKKNEHCFLLAFGLVYIAFPLASLSMIRNIGMLEMFWLLSIIWATDCGAYLFGSTIGGPKLIPSISPKKTWAGLIGGMICAAGVGALFAYFGFGKSVILNMALLSAGFAFFAQVGDFFESWVKRKLNIKDSSNLIPGHGGVFDRVDGLIAVAPIVAFLMWV